MISKEQTLNDLQNALFAATENGVLDDLAAYIHPDIINDFCEAVKNMITPEPEYDFDPAPKYDGF